MGTTRTSMETSTVIKAENLPFGVHICESHYTKTGKNSTLAQKYSVTALQLISLEVKANQMGKNPSVGCEALRQTQQEGIQGENNLETSTPLQNLVLPWMPTYSSPKLFPVFTAYRSDLSSFSRQISSFAFIPLSG